MSKKINTILNEEIEKIELYFNNILDSIDENTLGVNISLNDANNTQIYLKLTNIFDNKEAIAYVTNDICKQSIIIVNSNIIGDNKDMYTTNNLKLLSESDTNIANILSVCLENKCSIIKKINERLQDENAKLVAHMQSKIVLQKFIGSKISI